MAKKHILVVDDEVNFVNLIIEVLESRGYQAEAAHDIEEAIMKIKKQPDLILLDRTLGQNGSSRDGLELCSYLKKQREETARIPVIILTARGEVTDKTDGFYSGADDYITKPFHQEELIARMEAVLRRTQMFGANTGNQNKALEELRMIIETGSIKTFFQPIVSLSTKETIGLEALSRPSAGRILTNPELLFSAAVHFGLYLRLEMLCWQKAIRKWKDLKRQEKLFLNCDPYLLSCEDFDESLVLNDGGIEPSRIVLEVTEREDIKNFEMFLEKLERFRKIGFTIAVDDVGHGFSSLETMARLRPHFVKIDMNLVRNIYSDPLKKSIVSAIVSLCKQNAAFSIAEGIERKEEMDAVAELGVDAGQGYFFGRPSEEVSTGDLRIPGTGEHKQ